MPEFDDGELGEATLDKAPEQPKVDGKILTLTIKVSEGDDLGDIVTKATAIGEVLNLGLRENVVGGYGYGYDY